jgi:hypothetical protein
MMFINKRFIAIGLILVVAFMSLTCAPGNERWDQETNPGHLAGFWAGVWHGLIIVITFICSLFTSSVGLYEVSNTGWTYNLGFLIGLIISLGHIWRWGKWKKHHVKKDEWEKIGAQVEEKVRVGIKSWLDEANKEEKKKEWEEIGKKVEEKIKKALKEWTEK